MSNLIDGLGRGYRLHSSLFSSFSSSHALACLLGLLHRDQRQSPLPHRAVSPRTIILERRERVFYRRPRSTVCIHICSNCKLHRFTLYMCGTVFDGALAVCVSINTFFWGDIYVLSSFSLMMNHDDSPPRVNFDYFFAVAFCRQISIPGNNLIAQQFLKTLNVLHDLQAITTNSFFKARHLLDATTYAISNVGVL